MNTPVQAWVTREVHIASGDAWLYGDVVMPYGFFGVVLFVHGSGSGRHSARNRQVAQKLQQARMATLLFDLLTAQEEQVDLHTREHRFDISLLTRRVPTTESLSSTSKPCSNCAATRNSPSSTAPLIGLRSVPRWSRWPNWRQHGSALTWLASSPWSTHHDRRYPAL